MKLCFMGVSSSTLMWNGNPSTLPIASPHTKLPSSGSKSCIYAHFSCCGTTPRSILLNLLYQTYSYVSSTSSCHSLCLCSHCYHPSSLYSISKARMLGPDRTLGSFTVAATLIAHSGVGAFTHLLISAGPTSAVDKVGSNALASRLQQGNECTVLVRMCSFLLCGCHLLPFNPFLLLVLPSHLMFSLGGSCHLQRWSCSWHPVYQLVWPAHQVHANHPLSIGELHLALLRLVV